MRTAFLGCRWLISFDNNGRPTRADIVPGTCMVVDPENKHDMEETLKRVPREEVPGLLEAWVTRLANIARGRILSEL